MWAPLRPYFLSGIAVFSFIVFLESMSESKIALSALESVFANPVFDHDYEEYSYLASGVLLLSAAPAMVALGWISYVISWVLPFRVATFMLAHANSHEKVYKVLQEGVGEFHFSRMIESNLELHRLECKWKNSDRISVDRMKYFVSAKLYLFTKSHYVERSVGNQFICILSSAASKHNIGSHDGHGMQMESVRAALGVLAGGYILALIYVIIHFMNPSWFLIQYIVMFVIIAAPFPVFLRLGKKCFSEYVIRAAVALADDI